MAYARFSVGLRFFFRDNRPHFRDAFTLSGGDNAVVCGGVGDSGAKRSAPKKLGLILDKNAFLIDKIYNLAV